MKALFFFPFLFFFFFLFLFLFSSLLLVVFLEILASIYVFAFEAGRGVFSKVFCCFFSCLFVCVFLFFYLFLGNAEEMLSDDSTYFVNDGVWLDSFNDLDTSDTTIVEYVWIGGTGHDLRSKARSFPGKPPKSHADCPEWNFDGSSTGQAPGNDSEILLRPVAMFRDPFRRDPHKVSNHPSPNRKRKTAERQLSWNCVS